MPRNSFSQEKSSRTRASSKRGFSTRPTVSRSSSERAEKPYVTWEHGLSCVSLAKWPSTRFRKPTILGTNRHDVRGGCCGARLRATGRVSNRSSWPRPSETADRRVVNTAPESAVRPMHSVPIGIASKWASCWPVNPRLNLVAWPAAEI